MLSFITGKQPEPEPLTPEEKYNRQYNRQEGLCAACGDRCPWPRLFGIENLTWAHSITPNAPHELLCLTCAAAMKAAHKTPRQRRKEYIERYVHE